MPYRFKRKESVPEAVERIVTEQSQRASRELSGGNPDIHQGVHNARKCFKKIRSLLRLIRSDLGKPTYTQENDWFRSAAHQLAGSRDAEAMVETYDLLAESHPEINESAPLRGLRDRLVERRQRIVREQQDLPTRAQELARALDEMPERLRHWPLAHRGFKALGPGLERGYRRGRKAFRSAVESPTDEHFHEWRKRVKDYWYHMRLLRRIWPELMEPRIEELKRLSDLLGDDHDLAVLRGTLNREAAALGESAPLLACLAAGQQQRLREQASPLGRRLYASSPSSFAKEYAALWRVWKRG
jgi:CHAD domain-containing protein